MNSEYFVSFRKLESNFSCLFVLIELNWCFFLDVLTNYFQLLVGKERGF